MNRKLFVNFAVSAFSLLGFALTPIEASFAQADPAQTPSDSDGKKCDKIKSEKDKKQCEDETETDGAGARFAGSEPPFPDLGDIQAQYNSYKFDVLGDDLVGDNIDIDTGSLSLTQTDVTLPGNNNLPVSFGRSLSRYDFSGVWLGDWTPAIPYISSHYLPDFDTALDRCTGALTPPTYQDNAPSISYEMPPESYFSGFTLSIPGRNPGVLAEELNGGGSPEFAGKNARMVSKNNWIVTCLSNAQSGGEGFIVTAPNGDEYTFDFRQSYVDRLITVPAFDPNLPPSETNPNYDNSSAAHQSAVEVLYVSEIKDVHGNWVRYEYIGNRPSRIHSNDGREITFGYLGDKISTVTANGRVWTYQYSGNILTQVIEPDSRQWTISANVAALSKGATGICADHNSTSLTPVTITHPSGTNVTFDFTVIQNGRTHMDVVLPDPGTSEPSILDCYIGHSKRKMGTGFYSYAVTKKTLTVPNGGTYIWTRHYEQDTGSYTDDTSHPADSKKRTITDPNGDKTVMYVNRRFSPLEGALMKVETIPAGQSTPVRTIENSYFTGHNVGIELSGRHYGGLSNGSKTRKIYRTQSITNQDGDSFTTQIEYNTNASASDYSYGNPTIERRFSNVSTSPRETVTTYEHNTSKWILGLPKTVTQNSRQLATYTYDTLGQKTAQTRYGQPWRTFNYNLDGTLNWAKDALNRQISPSLWKRGIPQKVTFPDNTEIERSVDNNGWVLSQTDQLNRTDNYMRDTMGRLTQIDPHGSWDNTNITYNFSGGGAIQTVTKGQSRQTLTYDGLFRPILEKTEALDTGWFSYTNTTYDGLGRATFKSQPSLYASGSNGVNITYDALGRVLTQAENMSPFATTTHSYHSGHRHRVTDPSGAWKDYYSYGYEGPNNQDYKQIDENGLRHTLINDNIYGQTTSVVQYGSMGGVSVNATQYFYYDNNQRLCRYRGLEGGDTLYNYNAAGELTAYQKGLSAGTNCATPTGTGAVNLTYDPMGRLLTTNYVNGGAPDITRSYDAVGNLLTTNRTFVNWSYSYNDADLLVTENLQTEGRSYSLAYNYNTAGHMTHRTNPNGFQIAYAPDGLGRATKAQYQSLSYASGASYHPNGALSAFSYGNGFNFSQLLNARQLPSTMSAINGSIKALDQSYVYDSRAKITSVTDNADIGNNRSYGYDALGQMTSASGPWGGMAASYDSLGNLLSRNIGSRQINLSYDATQRLSSYTDSAGSNKDLSYDSRGNVTEMKVPLTGGCIQQRSLTYQTNPNATLWTHDAYVNVCTGEATLYAHSYNPNITPNNETFTFSYIPAGATQTVSKYTTINANGAQFLVIVEATTSTTGNLSMRHRVQRPDGSYSGWVNHGSIDFGPLGSPTHPDDMTFAYDYSDQPVQVSGKASAIYRYDGNFKRVKSAISGSAIYTIYNRAGELVHVDDLTTGTKTDYVRLNGRTVARVEDKITPTYVHGDHLGSPVSRSNSAGSLLPRERYTPFGITLNNPNDLNNQAGFTGHIKDSATGLNYMQARYYDPVIGRFLSVDPVTFMDKGDPFQFNRYAYANNDPVNMFDPNGEDSWLVSRPLGSKLAKGHNHMFVAVRDNETGATRRFSYGPQGNPIFNPGKAVSHTGTGTDTDIDDQAAMDEFFLPSDFDGGNNTASGISAIRIDAPDEDVIAAGEAVDAALGTVDEPADGALKYRILPKAKNKSNSNGAAAAVARIANPNTGEPAGTSNPGVDSYQNVCRAANEEC